MTNGRATILVHSRWSIDRSRTISRLTRVSGDSSRSWETAGISAGLDNSSGNRGGSIGIERLQTIFCFYQLVTKVIIICREDFTARRPIRRSMRSSSPCLDWYGFHSSWRRSMSYLVRKSDRERLFCLGLAISNWASRTTLRDPNHFRRSLNASSGVGQVPAVTALSSHCQARSLVFETTYTTCASGAQ